MTSTEFLDWIWYLDWKATEEFNRTDYYLANIAAQIEKGQVKYPQQVKLEHKLLKFTSAPKPEKRDKKRHIQNSKNYWMALCGAKKDK